MSQKIVINSSPTETRVAIVEDERLAELFVERGQRDRTLGSIYVGRVVQLAPSMQAAFVDLGLDSDGFLPFADARANLLEEASENGEEERKRGAPTGRRAARQAEPSLKVGQGLPVQGVKEPIESLPGQDHLSPDEAAKLAQEAFGLGVRGVLLFGLPAKKDPIGSEAWAERGSSWLEPRSERSEIETRHQTYCDLVTASRRSVEGA